MLKFWNSLNYLTRHQVYLRVLPVVFVSVMVLGIFSWVLFEHKTLTAASSHQQQELTQLTAGLRFQMTRLAMSAELRKSEMMGTPSADKNSDSSCAIQVSQGIIGLDQISATTQLPNQIVQSTAELPCLVLAPRFNTESNRLLLENWAQSQALPWVHQNSQSGVSSLAYCSQPTILESDPWHQILIFPPLFLEHATLGSESARGATSTTQFPLLIRHNDVGANHDHPKNHTLTLLMVDLGRLLDDMPTPDRLCFVDDDGQILLEQGGTDSNIFAGLSGKKLLSMKSELSTGRYQRGLVNRWSDPWMVATVSSPALPITLFSARPAKDLRTLIFRYLTFVIGMTTLALFGAILGVMRVMNRVTLRMSELAESMAALAKGDYSRRMREGRWDEIGQLIGYFNLMAISLDEAHREVKDKTVHLRAALANMRLLDKAKDDFLVLISHEVRTPLTSIMGGVDFLKSSLCKVSEEEQEILKRLNVTEVVSIIQSSGERLSGFMTDAIQMTAIQSADRQLSLKLNPVTDLVEMSLCGIREKASGRNITVENQLQNQVWSLLGDEKILKIALEKIFDNALVHNRDGGKILIREVREVPAMGGPGDLLLAESLSVLMEQPDYPEFEDDDIRWRLIEVYNSGEPIPEDRRKALFGKFELVERIEHHSKGSGLSLPIALGAVKCHGGRILLHSNNVDGNSFYLLLPTILDHTILSKAMADPLGNKVNQGIGGTAGDKKMGQVADLTALKVEIDDLGPTVDGGIHQTGGGVDSSSSSDHQEEVTVGCCGK